MATATRTRKAAELEIEFIPATNIGPFVGVMQLTKGRTSGIYGVTELASDEPGRWFEVRKVSGGSDDAGDVYVCRTTYGGNGLECGCRGWLRWGTACRHLEGLQHLILNEGV